MKSFYLILIFILTAFSIQLNAQADSLLVKKNAHRPYTQRDSIYLAKLNYTANLMIAGGVGLAAVGGFLVYEGVKIYNSPAPPLSTDPAADVQRNHRQGTAYFAASGIAFVGTAVLTALGARNKIEFKRRQKLMSLQSGLLTNSHLGAMLTF